MSYFTFFIRVTVLQLNKRKEVGQGARETVKVNRRKIQSSKRDTELLMGNY